MTETILDLARKKADAAEIYTDTSTELEVVFEAGSLKSVERKHIFAMGLRVIVDGRLGFSSSTDPERASDIVESAVASARFGKEVGFTFPGQDENPQVVTYDAVIESLGPEPLVEEGQRTIELLRENSPNGLTDIHFSAETSEVRILNTAGLDRSYRSTGFGHSVTSVIIEGDSILWIADGGSYGTFNLRTNKYVAQIGDLVTKSKRKAGRVSGSLPVIFVADEMSTLVSALEMGVNGKRLLKGDSPLIGREGEQVLGTVTLIDDPLIPNGPASCPFDGEGIPSRRNVLFQDGVFESFLFDLDTGAKTGRASTGSADRSALSLPGIDASNLVMKAGDTAFSDMISGLDEGIIVYGVLGGGQSNLLAGDFALNVMLGFHIEHGEYTGRLINTMVSGNVYEAFGNVRAVGSEIRQSGSLYVPDVCFASLPVTC